MKNAKSTKMKTATSKDITRTKKKYNPDCSKCHYLSSNFFCTKRYVFFLNNPKYCYHFLPKNETFK